MQGSPLHPCSPQASQETYLFPFKQLRLIYVISLSESLKEICSGDAMGRQLRSNEVKRAFILKRHSVSCRLHHYIGLVSLEEWIYRITIHKEALLE